MTLIRSKYLAYATPRCKPGDDFTCINLWPEALYMLRVDNAKLVHVDDIYAWNVNLVEEKFAAIPEVIYTTFTAATERGAKLLPPVLSSARAVPIFVPSIPDICDAIIDQLRYRSNHPENYDGKQGNRPSYHLRNFIRYLYLDREVQQDLLLPLLNERNRAEMEKRARTFMRKPSQVSLYKKMGIKLPR